MRELCPARDSPSGAVFAANWDERVCGRKGIDRVEQSLTAPPVGRVNRDLLPGSMDDRSRPIIVLLRDCGDV